MAAYSRRNVGTIQTTVYARKTADASPVNNSTTQVADPDLTLPVVSGGVYEVDIKLIYTSTTTADIAFGWLYPASSTMSWVVDGLVTSATSSGGQVNRANNTISTIATAGGPGTGSVFAFIRGIFTAGGDGNLQLTYAQNTADPTDTIVRARSLMKLTRVA